MSGKPTIDLWRAAGLCLIISHPSGVWYEAQVGGYACFHPQMEGVYVPVWEAFPDPQETALYEYFTGPKWVGHCYHGIDDETADFIDRVLSSSAYTQNLTVNRHRLKECMEAWVYVTIASAADEAGHLVVNGWDFSDFRTTDGVLTWQNSD